VRRVGQAEPFEQLVGPPVGDLARQVVEPAEHGEVAPPAQHLVHGRVLADQSDPVAHLVRLADHVETGDLGASAVRAQQGGQDAHGRGLAGTVRAEQPVHRSAWHGEIEPVERGGPAVPLEQTLGTDRDVGRSHTPPLTLYTVWRFNIAYAV